jgi:hypothetical protein
MKTSLGHARLVLALLPLLAVAPPAVAASAPYAPAPAGELATTHVRITPADKEELAAIVRSGMDIHHVRHGAVDALVTRSQLAEIRARGNRVDAERDVTAGGPLRDAAAWISQYKGYSELVTELNALASAHPGLASLSVIGSSLQGRSIYALKISDNVGTDESEPEVLIQADLHAREVIGPIIAMALADSLLTNYGASPQWTQWVDEREIWIVPTCNPDGLVYAESTDYLWRKNRRDNGDGTYGVDLNRNYDYEWGHDDLGSDPYPGSTTYRGASPASEPEIQVMQSFVDSRSFVFAISYHSYGNLVLWGPTYEPGLHEDEDIFAGFGAAASASNGYEPGNPASGTIYLVNGDSDDWAYLASANAPVYALSPEVGTFSDYFDPPASRIPTLVVEALDCATTALEYADRPGRLAPPGQPAPAGIPPSGDGAYDVTWSAPTTADTQVAVYELTEKTGPAVVIDDLESGAFAWNLGGWTVSSARSASGSSSLYSGSGNELNRILLAKEAYVVQPGDAFTFQTWYDIETGWDYAYAILSVDGGRSFVNLPGTGTTNADPHGTNAGNGISGSSGGWQAHSYDLSAWEGQPVWLGLRYSTDSGFAPEGIYVDDVWPVQTWASSSVLSSGVAGTSYSVSGRGDGTYWYSVRGRDAEGNWGYPSADVPAVVNLGTGVQIAAGGGFFLGRAAPSPFFRSTAIAFGLARPGPHTLSIYDVTGRHVRTLSQGARPAGPASVTWDGRDGAGRPVPAGVYFYRLTSGDGDRMERVVLLR